jgi:tetratricopeptide (TPR) repeat protein
MAGKNLKPEQEVELQRLLMRARIELRRGNLSEAESACRAALEMAAQDLETHEMLGDVLRRRGKLDAALAEYKTAMGSAPARASAETKYAEVVLAVGERESAKALANDMLENPHLYLTQGKKPGVSLFLSLLFPGLGQVYNGEIVKAAIICGSFLIWIACAALFQHYPPNIRSVQELLQDTNPLVGILGFIAIAGYIYGIIDAPVTAEKSNKPNKMENLFK